jgi:hypothetical protein
MENARIFYGHLEYVAVIWYILWPSGNVLVIWYSFPRFGILYPEKSGNPGPDKSFFVFSSSFILKATSQLVFSTIQKMLIATIPSHAVTTGLRAQCLLLSADG